MQVLIFLVFSAIQMVKDWQDHSKIDQVLNAQGASDDEEEETQSGSHADQTTENPNAPAGEEVPSLSV